MPIIFCCYTRYGCTDGSYINNGYTADTYTISAISIECVLTKRTIIQCVTYIRFPPFSVTVNEKTQTHFAE